MNLSDDELALRIVELVLWDLKIKLEGKNMRGCTEVEIVGTYRRRTFTNAASYEKKACVLVNYDDKTLINLQIS